MGRNEELELKTKAFVTDLLASVNIDDSIQNIISYIVEEIGNFTHSDMVCIYESGTEPDCINKVYQWKAGDSVLDDEKRQPIKERVLDEWIEALKFKKIVLVEDKKYVPDSMPLEHGRMEKKGINAFMIIPLYTKDRVPACMSLINPDLSSFALSESTWLYLGQEIGLFYHRERINREHLSFMEGIRSSNLSEFIVDYKTRRYEAFRITRVLNGVIPKEGGWDWLIKFYASIIKPEYREEFLRKTGQEYLETILHTEQSSFTIDLEREVNGRNAWFRLEFSVVSLDEKGHLERFIVLVKDITQMKKEEEEYHQVITALSSFYKASFIIDMKNRALQAIKHNDSIKQDYPDGKVPYDRFIEVFIDRMVNEDYAEIVHEFMNIDTIEQRLKDTNVLSCEYHRKSIEWGRLVITPAKWNNDDELEKVVFAVQDITEQKNREEWMHFKMNHDELTGALNRTAFKRVTKLLEKSVSPFALIILDIDKFKGINDTYGHDTGDEVLSNLTDILKDKIRTTDKLFRIGGDEFAIIMKHLTVTESETVKNIIEQVNQIITPGMKGLPPFSISAGVTFSVEGYDETVYHNADSALYRTKRTTRRGCTVFEEMG